jgi:hypothetical protein
MSGASVVEFLFIVLVPLVVVAGALVSLFAVGALFDLLDHPGEARGRIEGAFKRPPAAPRATAKDHFYQAHWTR